MIKRRSLKFFVCNVLLQFFTTHPLPCQPFDLPKYPPTKEIDAKRRDEEYRRYYILNFEVSNST